MPPPDDLWKGKNGVINRILDVFQIRNLGYYVWVRDILQAVRECIVSDKEYTGQLPKKDGVELTYFQQIPKKQNFWLLRWKKGWE